MSDRPILLIDIDGVLNPFAHLGDLPSGWEMHEIEAVSPRGAATTYTVYLSSRHGEWLNELATDFDLAWATTWEQQANTLISPKLGIPSDLPVAEVIWRMTSYDKSEGVAELVGDRPCAWLDDIPGRGAFLWRDERVARGIPTLLITPDPAIGFTRKQKEQLHRFAVALRTD